MKCAGLGAEQLKRRSAAPSTLTLHGLVRHMAEVERDWFRICFAGQDISALYSTDEWPNVDFDDLEAADPARPSPPRKAPSSTGCDRGKLVVTMVTLLAHG